MEINRLYFFPKYDANSLKHFINLEKATFKKKNESINKTINSLNETSANLLVKIIKFYYSDINNRSSHMHVAIDSIMSFIFNRISNFSNELKINYCLNHKFITPKFLEQQESYNFFKITMSKNMSRKYNHNSKSNVTIDQKLEDCYSIECSSRYNIKYLCSKYMIREKLYKNYKGQSFQIPFSVLRDPQLYVSDCNCYINKLITMNVYIIRLENQDNLIIINWPNQDRHPFNIIYNFLIMNGYNFANIINNSVKKLNIKLFALPLLDDIRSNFQNMHVPLEDMSEFKELFVDNQNNMKKCSEFNFSNFSELSNGNNEMPYHNQNVSLNDCLIINNSFLYLIFSKKKLLLSGGIFDCDDVISSQSYFTPNLKRIKFFSF